MKPLIITGIKTKEQYDACHAKLNPSSTNHWRIRNNIEKYPNFYFEGRPNNAFYNCYHQSAASRFIILSISQFLSSKISFKTLYQSL